MVKIWGIYLRRKVFVILGLFFVLTLVACSKSKEEAKEINNDVSYNNKTDDTEDPKITKEFLEQNAKLNISYEEVREIFGEEDHSEPIDGTITWIYDNAKSNDFTYDRTAEVVASDEIKSEQLDYQLFVNFIDEKAAVYSYMYKGEDGKLRQTQISAGHDIPLETVIE